MEKISECVTYQLGVQEFLAKMSLTAQSVTEVRLIDFKYIQFSIKSNPRRGCFD